MALRIPVAPIGSPATLLTVDHFVAARRLRRIPPGWSSRGCRTAAPRSRRRRRALRRWERTTDASHWPLRHRRTASRRSDALPLPESGWPTSPPSGPARWPPRCWRPRRRRDQDRGRAPARWHALRRGPATHVGAVVGVGPGIPVQQQEQARRQRRAQPDAGRAIAWTSSPQAISSSRTSRRGSWPTSAWTGTRSRRPTRARSWSGCRRSAWTARGATASASRRPWSRPPAWPG